MKSLSQLLKTSIETHLAGVVTSSRIPGTKGDAAVCTGLSFAFSMGSELRQISAVQWVSLPPSMVFTILSSFIQILQTSCYSTSTFYNKINIFLKWDNNLQRWTVRRAHL